MDNQEVKYTLILEGIDRMESGMKSAKVHTDALDHSFGHLQGMIREIGIAIGLSFGIEKLVEFGKESVKQFEKIEHAKTQLTNALQNRDIEFSMEELNSQAEEYSKKWIYSKEQIM